MSIILIIVLVILALWDSSGSAQVFGAVGIPLLSVTALLGLYLATRLDRVFIPLLAAGLVLDLYGGMTTGTITLSLLLAFSLGDLIRSRWLSGSASLIKFFLAASIYLIFNLFLLLFQLIELHRISVPHNPLGILIAAALGGVIAVLLNSLTPGRHGELSVKGLE
jgi:hypothetical protein